ncbi:MAG: glucose dehydrogenase [Anaerolineae bacterium]|nr:glucose dehydrogenase [Anaerolineae bacterium]
MVTEDGAMKKVWFVVVATLAMLFPAGVLLAQGGEDEPVITRDAPPDPALVTYTQVASGFDRPLLVTHAGDGSGRLFVVEQTGRIWIVRDGERLPTPFLDLSASVTPISGYSEQGLLGLAFHPAYADNGRLFVSYTDRQGTSVVAEYAVAGNNPDVANPASARELLRVAQPYPNHNGGMIAFGPDGYLYISLGDGGSAGDPQGNAQNPWTLLGAILRIDVDSAARPYGIPADNPFALSGLGAPEIWAWGLRNVWRFSFDRATGDLYLADVGQNLWEEVNFQPADSPGGENYGWNRYEGTHPYSGGPAPENMVLPVAEYAHNEGGCSISGGYVYRGEAIPDLQGVYFYGDWCTGNIFALYRDTAGEWQSLKFTQLAGKLISSFGEDEAGELYVVDYTGGGIWRMDPAE